MKVVLVRHVENLDNLGPAEHWWVQLVTPAVWTEVGNASADGNCAVDNVASNNVPAHAFDHVCAFRGAHLIDHHVEAHEVDVVG